MGFNKSRLLWGGLVLCVMALALSWNMNHARSALNLSKSVPVLSTQTLGKLQEDDQVAIFGVISMQSPRFYQDLAMGVYEVYYSGEDGGWEVENDPSARLKVEIDANTAVDVFYDSVYPKGHYQTIGSGNSRYKGYLAGSAITTMAVVSSTNPLSFDATAHYGGTLAQYQRSLVSRVSTSWWISLILLSTCLIVMFWPSKK